MNLLDTHTLIWFINGDKQFSAKAKNAIEQNEVENFISIATLWELAIKITLGKLDLNISFATLEIKLKQFGFKILPVTFNDTLQLTKLPFHHKDPFDRILISQSITNRLTLVSKDNHFHAYGISVLW